MKLRLFANSLRLRVSDSQMRQLLESGTISESTQFAPDQRIDCVLRIDDPEIRAEFAQNTITLSIPRPVAIELQRTRGVEHLQRIDAHSALRILIEIDLKPGD